MKLKLTLLLLTFSAATYCQENKQLFKSDVKANVTKNDTIDLDKYKDLVVIPGGSFRMDLKKIGYFKNIMSENEYRKSAKKSGFTKPKYNMDTKEGRDNLFKDYKKFIYFYQSPSLVDKNGTRIVVQDIIMGEKFIVEGRKETSVIGITAGTKYLPEETKNAMLNALVDFIRANSKTF